MSKVRGGTVSLEDMERAKKNIIFYIENSTSPYNKNDVKEWVFILHRAAKRKIPK